MKKLLPWIAAATVVAATLLPGCGGVASSESSDAAQTPGMPAKYDLRDKGLVTPVKSQNPWGTCWAFGAIASAESSALSLEGKTYEENPIDFSEKHMIVFAPSPVTEVDNTAQAGEGIYVLNENESNAIYNLGGMVSFADTLLASGGGPRSEKSFPYRGANGTLQSDWLKEHKEEVINKLMQSMAQTAAMQDAAMQDAAKTQEGNTQDDATQGNAAQGGTTQDDVAQGNAAQSDATQSGTQGNATQSDTARSDVTQEDATQSNAAQGGTTRGTGTKGGVFPGTVMLKPFSQGYDAQGYDVQGYDAQGYDQQGYDQQGYGTQGYDTQSYGIQQQSEQSDKQSIDASGYRKKAEQLYSALLEKAEQSDSYSAEDDWSISSTDEMGRSNRSASEGYTLRDTNVLPSLSKRGKPTLTAAEGPWEGRSEEGERAVKDELLNGHAVSAMVYAEESVPGEELLGKNMNVETWSQYTFEPEVSPNHNVCIVGWDDNYAKENFTHDIAVKDENGEDVTNEDGTTKTDPDSAKNTTPPGDGAWIVKNSWGSETDAIEDGMVAADGTKKPANYGKWGIVNDEGKHTGYYYISYYDTSLNTSETLVLDNDLAAGDFDILQHDYLCSTESWDQSSKDVMSAANVFTVQHDGVLRSVATRTQNANSTVEFTVRKVAKGCTNPEEGPTIAKFSQDFPYAGFHRVDLPEKVEVKSGEYISIVTTVSSTNDQGELTYSVSAARCPTRSIVERLAAAYGEFVNVKDLNLHYGKGVINAGESFLKRGEEWMDWSTYPGSDELAQYLKEEEQKEGMDGGDLEKTAEAMGVNLDVGVEDVALDNFCIKAYIVPIEGVGNIHQVSTEQRGDTSGEQVGLGTGTNREGDTLSGQYYDSMSAE